MIPEKSSWPFHGLLVGLAADVEKAPEAHRVMVCAKMVQRCIRLAVKLATHFGVSPAAVTAITLDSLREEGGSEYAAVLGTAFDTYALQAVEAFKASEGYKEHAAVVAATSKVNGKGGDA